MSPGSIARLRKSGEWFDVDGLELEFNLTAAATVVLSYGVSVRADKTIPEPAEHFLSGARRSLDAVSSRLLVDGAALRPSGAHAGFTGGAIQTSRATLRARVAISLSAGLHRAVVQWRKWGTAVDTWASVPSAMDGFTSPRWLAASAAHAIVWYAQPLTQAQLAGPAASTSAWRTVPGMSITLELASSTVLNVLYSLSARPMVGTDDVDGEEGGGGGEIHCARPSCSPPGSSPPPRPPRPPPHAQSGLRATFSPPA